MRVTYEWTEQDWSEAVTLATEPPRRRGSVPGMVYALVGIPLIGAVVDGVTAVRGTGKLTGAGMAVPVLIVALAVALGAGIFVANLQRRRRIRSQLPMPDGQWEAVLLEAGWDFHAKPEQTAATAGVKTGDNLSTVATILAQGKSVVTDEVCDAVAAAAATEPQAIAPSLPLTESIVDTETRPAGMSAAAAKERAVPVESARLTENAEAGIRHVPSDEPAPESATPVALAAEAAPVRSATAELQLRPWKDLTGSRTGDHVMVFLHANGFNAVPIRCMTPEQAGHLHRMAIRKLRPSPVAR